MSQKATPLAPWVNSAGMDLQPPTSGWIPTSGPYPYYLLALASPQAVQAAPLGMLAGSAQMFRATVDSSWWTAAVLLPAVRKSGSSLAARSSIERRQLCANGVGHLSTHLR